MTLLAPYYESHRVTLYCGDCRDILPALGGIDAVVTDPPYGCANDCDYTRFSGGQLESIAKRGKGRDYGHPIIGDNQAFDPTPWLTYERVLMFGYNHFAHRLPTGTVLVWIKRLDGAFGSFLSDAELAWMNRGHGVYCQRDTSLMGETRQRMHPTQKPVSLMEWAMAKLKVASGMSVLDPYMGSGTTGVACIKTGRKFIGIEIDPSYCEIAKRRIQEAEAQLPLLVGVL